MRNEFRPIIHPDLLWATIQKFSISAPRLSAWMEENLSEGFTIFEFPLEHNRLIRTTNSLERVNKEFKIRTRVVGVLQNEASCVPLVSELLMETSEDRQIGKRYCSDRSLTYYPTSGDF
jgi:transposase-like protein